MHRSFSQSTGSIARTAPHAAMTRFFGCAGLLATCLTSLPAAAWTLNVTPDTTQYMSDPSFIPSAGQIYSETSYARTHGDYDFSSTDGFNGSRSTHNNQFTQQIWVGVTDDLSVSGSATYQLSDVVKQFENPTFSILYRVIAQTRYPVSVDVEANYSPPAANSNQSGGPAIYVSREMKSFTVQGEFGATYYHPSSDLSHYWGYFVGLRSQWRFMDHWALNSGVGYSGRTGSSSSFTDLNASFEGGSSSSTTYDGTIAPYVALTYEIWPTHANIALEYQHAFIGDSHTNESSYFIQTNPLVANNNTSYSSSDFNQSQDLFAIHLRLLF
jgi:hypothetical protein